MTKWFLMLCTGLTLVGCSTSTDQTLTTTFNIDATNSPGPGGCSVVTRAIDLTDISAFDRVQDRVQKVELLSLKVTVANPKLQEDSVATSAHGNLAVADENGANPATVGVYEPLQLIQDNSIEAAIDTAGSSTFAELATHSPFRFDVVATGCVDQYPARFSLQVDMKARVTFKLF